jgi:hypothetical protein
MFSNHCLATAVSFTLIIPAFRVHATLHSKVVSGGHGMVSSFYGKVVPVSIMPRRHMGKWMYRSTFLDLGIHVFLQRIESRVQTVAQSLHICRYPDFESYEVRFSVLLNEICSNLYRVGDLSHCCSEDGARIRAAQALSPRSLCCPITFTAERKSNATKLLLCIKWEIYFPSIAKLTYLQLLNQTPFFNFFTPQILF